MIVVPTVDAGRFREPPPLGSMGRFSLIYADPPWQYRKGGAPPTRVAENHFPTMDLADICALRVADICAKDVVLFLWATSPKVAEALQVMASWGFDYRTQAVWVKDRIGLGSYFRQRHELLLVGVRGKPGTPPIAARVDSVIQAKRGAHSAKPEGVYAIIEAMYPEASRIELFARGAPRKGWATWGNEVHIAEEPEVQGVSETPPAGRDVDAA